MEGTSSLGFHSGMNFAGGVEVARASSLCQNNQLGHLVLRVEDADRVGRAYAIKGEAYGIPGVTVDGNDVLAVRQGRAPKRWSARAYRRAGRP